MNTYTLNLEAPGASASDVIMVLHTAVGIPGSVKVRPHQSSYQGPDGPVVTESWVAHITTGNPWPLLQARIYAAAKTFEQDCIAVRDDSTCHLSLVGSRADRWEPANPDYFVSY